MYQKVQNGLMGVYSRVDDIDLYVGGLMELVKNPRPGPKQPTDSVVGPTFACLIAEHFSKMKNSDRFFYERGGQPGSFSLSKYFKERHITNI